MITFLPLAGLSSSTHYTSSYQPRKVAALEGSALDFIKFNFTKTTYSTDSEGNVNEQFHTGIYEIEVASNWQKDAEGSQLNGGYISKGLMKFAFKVSSRLRFYGLS